MTKITIELDAIDYAAAGIEGKLDPSELHPDSLAYIFTYGARRVMQDSLNSAAHKARKDGDESFNVNAFHDARIAALKEGTVGARGAGGGVDAVTRKMVSLIRKNVKAADAAWYKNADESDRFARCVEALAKLPEAQADTLRKHAEAELKREAEAAKAAAALNITIEL